MVICCMCDLGGSDILLCCYSYILTKLLTIPKHSVTLFNKLINLLFSDYP
jgi:hypothetical protein